MSVALDLCLYGVLLSLSLSLHLLYNVCLSYLMNKRTFCQLVATDAEAF